MVVVCCFSLLVDSLRLLLVVSVCWWIAYGCWLFQSVGG